MTTAPFVDRVRLERILEPWTADADGPAVAILDADGSVVAGRTATSRDRTPSWSIRADVLIDGARVGEVVASDGSRPGSGLAAVVRALAAAIGELAVEARARGAAERALEEVRSAAAATALGTDVGQLAKGRRQQRSIVSLVAPDLPGYDLASQYDAAGDIGGDFFELFRLRRRGHPLGLVIADVTGKGLDAALLMAFSRPVMHSALQAARGPADALERTNRVLVDERRGTLFITAICAVLEPRSGRIRLADAGHEPPFLVPADGSLIREIGEPAVLIGAFAKLDVTDVELVLEPGDVLLFYTDGVTDAVDPTGHRFGDERLLATLAARRGDTAHGLVAALTDAVRTFRAEAPPADDVTIVAIGRHPQPTRRARAARSSA